MWFDLNLNQKQKVLRAGAYAYFMRDYGIHAFYGQPRQDQSLEEVKDLMLAELENIKNGEFDEGTHVLRAKIGIKTREM